MKHRCACLIVLAVALLSGCTTASLVPSGTASVNGVSFQSSGVWNQLPPTVIRLGGFAATCTADGPELERLIFVSGVPGGKPVFTAPSKDAPMPAFDAALLVHEIPDFLSSSLANLSPGEIRYETSDVRPAALSGTPGVRFKL